MARASRARVAGPCKNIENENIEFSIEQRDRNQLELNTVIDPYTVRV